MSPYITCGIDFWVRRIYSDFDMPLVIDYGSPSFQYVPCYPFCTHEKHGCHSSILVVFLKMMNLLSCNLGHGGGVAGMIAGGAAAAAAALGAHHVSHGAHNMGYGAPHMGYGGGMHHGGKFKHGKHGKFKHGKHGGKYKRGKHGHGMFGGGKNRKWK